MRFAAVLALLLSAATALAHPPVSVVLDSRGNVYYSDLQRVWRIGTDGRRSVAVPKVHTHELSIDGRDQLYGEHLWYEGDATKKWGHYVWRRDAAGRITKVIGDREGFLSDYGFARDAAGNLYWPRRERGQILRRAPNGSIARVAGELKGMRFLHATPAGTLYVVDGNDLVRVEGGRATRLARGIARQPFGVWSDRAGNVYVADYAARVVKRVTPGGAVSTFLTSSAPWSPVGGTFAPNGDLWLLETSATHEIRVRRVLHGQ